MWEEEEEEKRDKGDSHRGGGEGEKGSLLPPSLGRRAVLKVLVRKEEEGRGSGKKRSPEQVVGGEREEGSGGYIYPRRLQSLFIVRCDSDVGMTPKTNTTPNPKVPSCQFPFPSSIQVFLFPAAAASKRFYDEGKAK